MSLNIQTANGLLEIGGGVTKEKVISALGYEPADEKVETTIENHIKDTDIHITSEEREILTGNVESLESHKSDKTIHVTSAEKQTWNNKSDFSGAYADLIDAPNITENDSGNMVIADESGNIIMQVDADGLETTNVSAKTIELNGEDLGVRLDELESMTLPNILDNESDDLSIADEAGNVIVKINKDGLETTTVTAKSAVINGVDIVTKLDEHKEDIDGVSEDLTTHTTNSSIHITSDERTLWNNKSDFSGDYNDLTNAPDITEDASGEVVYADESGNVIAKIGENGFETTQVIADTVIVNGANVEEKFTQVNERIDNISIPSLEGLATEEYVDTQVAALVDSSPETLNTLNELAAALGDDPNFATTVATQIGLKADKATLDTHTSDKVAHITSEERETWNAKSDFSGDYNDLENAPNIYEDNSNNLVIADQDGNIIFKSDVNGFETTTVTAQSVVVNGTDVETALNSKAASSHTHDQYLEATDISGKADTTYVDEQLETKANKCVPTKVGNLATLDANGNLTDSGVMLYNVTQYAEDKVYEHSLNDTHITENERIAWNAKVDKTYVDEEIDTAIVEVKADASSKDAVILLEAQKSIETLQTYVDEELAEKVDSAEISHSTDTIAEGVTISNGNLSIVVDAYTKAETLNKIQEKITEINGGESAGEVLSALNSYKEVNNARVGAIEVKNDAQDEVISQIQQNMMSSDDYYTKLEIDNFEFITVADIDRICGVTA